MDTLLGTIFLVLPGIIAFYIYKMIGPTSSKAMTDYERTIYGLIYNIPGMLLAWGILSINSHQKLKFDEFKNIIFVMPCIIFYFAFVLCTAIFCAYWWHEKGHEFLLKWVNKGREVNRPRIMSVTPWEQFVGNEKEGLLKIYPIGEENKAIIGIFSLSWMPGDTEKGVLLYDTDWLTQYNDWLKTPQRTYVDTVTKTVYEFYLLSDYNEARERAKSEPRS
ncbi:MAG TPA: hypothetical protein VJ824_13060 [Bacillota bacterium]|nr:hypothetical protein [Bacillota bacterium]